MLGARSPEVHNNLLHLLHVQREIVVFTPPGPAAHLAPAVCLIVTADETCHSRVIFEIDEEVGAVRRCAVVGQQSEEVRKSSSQLHSGELLPLHCLRIGSGEVLEVGESPLEWTGVVVPRCFVFSSKRPYLPLLSRRPAPMTFCEMSAVSGNANNLQKSIFPQQEGGREEEADGHSGGRSVLKLQNLLTLKRPTRLRFVKQADVMLNGLKAGEDGGIDVFHWAEFSWSICSRCSAVLSLCQLKMPSPSTSTLPSPTWTRGTHISLGAAYVIRDHLRLAAFFQDPIIKGPGSQSISLFFSPCSLHAKMENFDLMFVKKSSCTALNRKALQREVKAAQHITRTELPSMEDLYTQRCRKKATKIIKDPSHPATNCSACCRLADGSAAFEPEPPGSGKLHPAGHKTFKL
ncbi:hypothetical protein L3Q82_000030 [Scortum barcoo]|uniref:Uncharacterized protein n=1 Tax=Scortum barcoo TaxID=214431 RepID=A0ACB8XA36_9TELE|nr:hypothetical protein L3Q82_000030 [Scortum barcoo]